MQGKGDLSKSLSQSWSVKGAARARPRVCPAPALLQWQFNFAQKWNNLHFWRPSGTRGWSTAVGIDKPFLITLLLVRDRVVFFPRGENET